MVLIHGFPFDHTMWQQQIDSLSSACRVIAPDLRGFGRSSQTPEDAANGVEMRRYAEDLRALLVEIGVDKPAVICGFSMGGYVLWQFALAYPEMVEAVILCDTRADADAAEGRQARLQMAEKVLQAGTAEVPGAMVPRLLAAETIADRQDIVDQVTAMILESAPEAIAAAQRGMAQREDVRERLGEIGCPALAIVGEQDAISPPAEMRAIADAMPKAELVEIAKAGHMAPLENPAAVNEALSKFVQSL